jgi:hypothetical protein
MGAFRPCERYIFLFDSLFLILYCFQKREYIGKVYFGCLFGYFLGILLSICQHSFFRNADAEEREIFKRLPVLPSILELECS